MTNQMIKAKANDVSMMGVEALRDFGVVIDMSNIDNKSKEYLYMAIDERFAQLALNEEFCNADVECSEVKEGDMDE